MLTLTNGTTFDLSQYVTNHEFSVSPSFEWVETLSGKITKKSDLGITSDRYFCTLDITIPHTYLTTFKNWYASNRGLPQTISTDLDLFFPNKYVYPGSCVPYDLKFSGYLGSDYWSKHHVFELTLMHVGYVEFVSPSIIPSVFSRGVWTNDYTFAETFQHSITGNNFELITSENDVNNWSVDFEYLTRDQCGDLVRWLLTVRTTKTTINRPSSLGGYTRDMFLKSFDFANQGTYYTGTIDIVEATNYRVD